MVERERIKTSTVTLDIELQDLLDVVSKSGSKPPLSNEFTTHSMEGEDLKKAWFKHVLISMEKLNDQIESIRRTELIDIQNEFKEFIKRIETKVDKAEDELKVYKKEIIVPLSDKVLTLAVKMGIYSVIAGFVGSGLMGIIVYIIKEYIIKSAVTGGR